MFMDRMRTLIIPPKLANGKMSTCQLKAVTVYFEDASHNANGSNLLEGTNKNLTKQVSSSEVAHSITNTDSRVNHQQRAQPLMAAI